MPPRDEQDYESKKQQIIDAAMRVFASKGYERATNKDIAEAANIRSAGLIYHYFKDKADLFRQVLEQRAPAIQLIMRGNDLMDLPPREVLPLFAQAFFDTFKDPSSIAMFRLMLSESIRHQAVADMLGKVGPARALDFLARYLAHQMDLGTLRRMDPAAAARCFVGPALTYLLAREVFALPDSEVLSRQTMIETMLEVFFNGMAVEGAS